MNKFTVYFKSGGGDAIQNVDEYWKLITSILNKMSENHYTEEIECFHIALRVDGDYFSFGDPEGCNNLKLFLKKRILANSISFGKEVYIEKEKLSEFLKNHLLLAFEQMVKRLEKEKIKIKGESLLSDLRKLMNEHWEHNE